MPHGGVLLLLRGGDGHRWRVTGRSVEHAGPARWSCAGSRPSEPSTDGSASANAEPGWTVFRPPGRAARLRGRGGDGDRGRDERRGRCEDGLAAPDFQVEDLA